MDVASLVWRTYPSHLRQAAEDLRGSSLVLIVAGATPVFLAWFLSTGDPAAASTWLPPLAALGICLGSVPLEKFRPGLAAAAVALCLLAANSLALWRDEAAGAAFLFVVCVFVAATLLGPVAATAAGAIAIVQIEEALRLGVTSDASFALSAIVVVGFGVVVAWASSYPVLTALAWAWNSYDEALRRTEELRDRQGELNRALASLNETCYRLEVANQELARARSAAEEARQLKSEFAANISHELRTPLNLIIGFSEILMSSPGGNGRAALTPEARADVDVIYRNARHLSNLIDDVLDLSQVDAGRMGLTKERVALAAIVNEAIAAVARLFEARGLTVCSTVGSDLPPLFVDRTRIRQVLINLLNNASRFTVTGGATISAIQSGGNAIVRVADTGVGIAPEDIPKAFEEFRQLDGSTRRPHDGSGLGLAICQRFVEMHGGAIWAESQLGQGTTFSFTLPLIENVASATLRPEWETWVRLPQLADEAAQRVVVLINQDPRIDRLFARYLDGYRVLPARDEAEALRLFAQTTVHGVVLTTSPDAPVEESLRRLHETPRNVPVVACSLPSSASMGEHLGVADYLVKPISSERLLETLSRVTSRARTILVVDDDPEMVRLLARMIRSRSHRYQVIRAYGGESALALLAERRPDVVILDLVMPVVDGYAVLREMRGREEFRSIPVIAITARSYEAETVAAGALEITREGGLSLRELMGCLKASLDSIAAPAAPAESAEAPTLALVQ
jgi:signal transduction histidine kinase/DNA-binding response OmpR family regulator